MNQSKVVSVEDFDTVSKSENNVCMNSEGIYFKRGKIDL